MSSSSKRSSKDCAKTAPKLEQLGDSLMEELWGPDWKVELGTSSAANARADSRLHPSELSVNTTGHLQADARKSQGYGSKDVVSYGMRPHFWLISTQASAESAPSWVVTGEDQERWSKFRFQVGMSVMQLDDRQVGQLPKDGLAIMATEWKPERFAYASSEQLERIVQEVADNVTFLWDPDYGWF